MTALLRSSLAPRALLPALWALAGLLAAPHAARADDGATLYQARCVACHGARAAGNATLQAPPLAGGDATYLARQLRGFRSQHRGGDSAPAAARGMQAVAQALPGDAAIDALARYLATLPAPARTATPVPAGSALNAGKALFAVCVACHGHSGEGTPALQAPRLNHLPGWYLESQLRAFLDGSRGAHPDDAPGQQMRQVASDLLTDDTAVRDLVAFLGTLGTGRR